MVLKEGGLLSLCVCTSVPLSLMVLVVCCWYDLVSLDGGHTGSVQCSVG